MGAGKSIPLTELDARYKMYVGDKWTNDWSVAAKGYATDAQTAAQLAAQTYTDTQWSKDGGWKSLSQGYANAAQEAAQLAAQGYATDAQAAAQLAAQTYADTQWSKPDGWSASVDTRIQNVSSGQVADIWNKDQKFTQNLAVQQGLTVGGSVNAQGGVQYGNMAIYSKNGKTCLGTPEGPALVCMSPDGQLVDGNDQNIWVITNDSNTLPPLTAPETFRYRRF